MDILPELMDMIFSCLGSTVKTKKKIEYDDDEAPPELTTEILMLRAIERGLCLKDFEDLTVGMIVGFITAYNNEQSSSGDDEQDKTRVATQADFNSF